MYKSPNIIQVPRVKVAGEVVPVRFKINRTAKHIKASTPGRKSIRVFRESKGSYYAATGWDGQQVRGPLVRGKLPRKVFEAAVNKFWK